jgi:hypothetical protein
VSDVPHAGFRGDRSSIPSVSENCSSEPELVTPEEDGSMARRPNYGGEKRQKEIQRQKKKDEKAEKKKQRKDAAAAKDQRKAIVGESGELGSTGMESDLAGRDRDVGT